MMLKSIRTRITLLTVCGIIISITVSAILGLTAIKRTGDKGTEQILRLLCETGEKNLDYYINSVEQSVNNVHAYVESDLRSISEDELKSHLDRVSYFFERTVNRTNGVLTYYYRIDPEISENVKGFWYTNLDGTGFTEHEVTDITLYDTSSTDNLVWFTVPKNTGSSIWLSPYKTDNLDAYVISYNVPIYLNKVFVGVIGIEIDYSTMSSQVDNIRLYDRGYAFISDQNGKIIYHPMMDVISIPEAERSSVPEELRTSDDLIIYRYNGEKKEAVWKDLNNGMRLFVSVPQSEINGTWYRLMMLNLAVMIVILAVFIFVTTKFSKRIVSPLRRLTKAVSRLKSDSFDFSLDYNEDDEVGILTRTFRNLSEHLKLYITAMDADYRSIYYVDLDRNLSVCYRSEGENELEGIPERFNELVDSYAEKNVSSIEKESFLAFLSPEHIRNQLEVGSNIAFRYQTTENKYEMVRITDLSKVEGCSDDLIHSVAIGFSDVDRETRDEFAKNAALSDALNHAKEANEAKTSFLNSMSHEIRTPMNAIIGYNNIALKDPDLSDSTRDSLEKIKAAASHLLELINNILDMSHIESGRMTLKNERFSFSDLIGQINSMICGQCSQKSLEYECNTDGNLDEYYIGDAMKIKQVLINILANAVKYTPSPGSITFTVTETARFNGNATLRFIVKDTGIGMEKEYLPKIFDAFSKEEDKRDSMFGSTGLGMAITRNIVDMMNGKIEVESKKGKGSVFTVIITLKTAEQDDLQSTEKSVVSETETENKYDVSELSGKHILMAEDMFINAEILRNILESYGMTVDHASDGRECADRFKDSAENYYDAVLMDIRMPVLDGLGAAEVIRGLERADAKTIPIIAMTANAFDEDVQLSLQAGMNAHLTKPVEADRLLETLLSLVVKRR